jgi:hypothetical protein
MGYWICDSVWSWKYEAPRPPLSFTYAPCVCIAVRTVFTHGATFAVVEFALSCDASMSSHKSCPMAGKFGSAPLHPGETAMW